MTRGMSTSTFRMGEVAALLGASADTVRRLADAGKLRTKRTAAGHRVVEGAELARFLVANLESPDADVVVAQSARNRFPGIVTRILKDKVAAQVEIHAGPHRIVSLMTREAADELGLAPGMRAIAAVKATNVVIEVPGPRRKVP
jgi:molybdopterin-binding protein